MSVMLTRIDEAIMPKKKDWVTPADVKPEASMAVDGKMGAGFGGF